MAESTINYSSVKYIKQSDAWKKYMELLGWECFEPVDGIKMYAYFFPLKFASMIKIPKPKNFNIEDLKKIEEQAKKIKALFIKIEPHQFQETDFLLANGYSQTSMSYSAPATLLIDLTKSEDELWDALSKSGKYGVRRARREGSIVKTYVAPDKEKVAEFHKIYLETGKNGKFFVRNINDLSHKIEAFCKKSYLLLGYDGKNILSGGKHFIANEDTVFYVDGATSDYGRHNRVGFDITWRSILYFKNLGYKIMDLEGMFDERFYEETKDWKGFTEFKLKFGAESLRFPKPWVKFLNPIFGLLVKVFKLEI